jgi:aquaporin Z
VSASSRWRALRVTLAGVDAERGDPAPDVRAAQSHPADSREQSLGVLVRYERSLDRAFAEFDNPRLEGRRLFSELFGTFFLVLVAAGAGMVGHAFPGSISRTAAVVAPGLMVMAIILFMGRISGAHLNPAVTIAFATRGDFPMWRVPGYIVVQLIGAALAAWFLTGVVDVSARFGGTYPGAGVAGSEAFLMEAVLTLGLVSVILGTASGAQNVGVIGAIGIGAYIALAGLWSSPLSAASMNPARSFGPDLVSGHWSSYWVYVAGPLAGGLLAVGVAWILRGPGGDRAALAAAQGTLKRIRQQRRAST